MEKKKSGLALHWKILIGMVAGVLWGILAIQFGWADFTGAWIKPFGSIFIKLLKLIAMPLILGSLITGVASLKDISKLSRIGGKTFFIYICTTAIAISVGLLIVNIIRPGNVISDETRTTLQEKYGTKMNDVVLSAEKNTSENAPLKFLEDMVPDNIVVSASDNKLMLQVIFFSILIGVALIMIKEEKARPMVDFFGSLNDVILKVVDIIMLFAPFGVMALIAGILVDTAGNDPSSVWDILYALLLYSITVALGLLLLLLLFYPALVYVFAKRLSPVRFFKGIAPAQMLAFSTSSSAATLPVSMERCEEHLGISKEVSSFVLPLGATINMDGTALYQGVAAVFIAQAYGIDLTVSQQLSIILTATLASIGSAAVPGAGMVMLITVLNSVGIPVEGLVLILAPDRILDMFRTTVNITSDCAVATIIATSEGQINVPGDTVSLDRENV